MPVQLFLNAMGKCELIRES